MMAVSARHAGKPAVEIQHLPGDQYMKTQMAKRQIVLHHTVGGSLTSTLRWWRDDPRRIATAYLVDRDGRIVEAFPPAMWAWHLGVKDREAERSSVGIELINVGPLRMDERSWRGIAVAKTVPPIEVEHHEWRGYHHWQSYPEAQVQATARLCRWLCRRFGITARVPPSADRALTDLPTYLRWEGVTHHAMLRKDKSDLHPGFDWATLEEVLTS
jgi:N-acetyl-anhydromuramyl-L-alanine amidase AmpD